MVQPCALGEPTIPTEGSRRRWRRRRIAARCWLVLFLLAATSRLAQLGSRAKAGPSCPLNPHLVRRWRSEDCQVSPIDALDRGGAVDPWAGLLGTLWAALRRNGQAVALWLLGPVRARLHRARRTITTRSECTNRAFLAAAVAPKGQAGLRASRLQRQRTGNRSEAPGRRVGQQCPNSPPEPTRGHARAGESVRVTLGRPEPLPGLLLAANVPAEPAAAGSSPAWKAGGARPEPTEGPGLTPPRNRISSRQHQPGRSPIRKPRHTRSTPRSFCAGRKPTPIAQLVPGQVLSLGTRRRPAPAGGRDHSFRPARAQGDPARMDERGQQRT